MTREGLAVQIVESLRNRGHLAYLVGGCVRDRLLGITPKDFDVSTSALPGEIASYFPDSRLVGAHFGVILVTAPDAADVEVATFRTEGRYTDGRRPDEVRFETDPALDAIRRDFTVNALMQDPVSGTVLDFVGGQRDLDARVIRAIGDPGRRFQEDYLRMLRAVRFAARLRFTIEPETMDAIRRYSQCVAEISVERVRDELVRILIEGNARTGFELLNESGLLEYVLPEVKAMQGVPQPPEFHPEGDVWTHVLLMLEQLQHATPTLALGALLHDVGKPPTISFDERIRFNGHAEVGADLASGIMQRLRFSRGETEQVISLVANHMRFKDARQMRTSTLKRFLTLPHFEEHLELHRLDCSASNGYTEVYRWIQQKLLEFGQEELRPERLINGRDLIQSGYLPGPAFARALEAVETAQLEGVISDRESALSVARSVLDQKSA